MRPEVPVLTPPTTQPASHSRQHGFSCGVNRLHEDDGLRGASRQRQWSFAMRLRSCLPQGTVGATSSTAAGSAEHVPDVLVLPLLAIMGGGGGGTRPHQGVAAAVATGISQQQHIVLHVWPPRDLVVGSHGRRRYARGLWEEGNECTRGERSRERSCNSLFRPRRTSGDALMGPLT